MGITRFEDIEAWQLARVLSRKIYAMTRQADFSKDYGLKDQIQKAAGSAMHNIAEGFDSETNAEFIRFLRYAKRSCSEVQSQLYVAIDNAYITRAAFDEAYEQARRTRSATRSFINYLTKYEQTTKSGSVRETLAKYVATTQTPEPLSPEPLNLPTPEPLNP